MPARPRRVRGAVPRATGGGTGSASGPAAAGVPRLWGAHGRPVRVLPRGAGTPGATG
jgi:hypothetical protein